MGECHKYAPRPTITEVEPTTLWPETEREEWCGEAEPVQEISDEDVLNMAKNCYSVMPEIDRHGELVFWDSLTEPTKEKWLGLARRFVANSLRKG